MRSMVTVPWLASRFPMWSKVAARPCDPAPGARCGRYRRLAVRACERPASTTSHQELRLEQSVSLVKATFVAQTTSAYADVERLRQVTLT
jgi:hypothetical protein